MPARAPSFFFIDIQPDQIADFNTRLQLYTVPGQLFYEATRRLVLEGADGVVFVADSQDFALDANLESLQNLEPGAYTYRVRAVNGAIVGGHEITVTSAFVDEKDGELKFVVVDSETRR